MTRGRSVLPRRVGLGRVGHAGKEATVKTEQAVAAGSAVCEVRFNALIVNLPIANLPIANLPIAKALIVNRRIVNRLIANLPIANALIVNRLIVNWLIANSLIIDALMIGALRLVTLGRIRSRTGSSNPVVFNLSIAQVLRLFSHWSHISLI